LNGREIGGDEAEECLVGGDELELAEDEVVGNGLETPLNIHEDHPVGPKEKLFNQLPGLGRSSAFAITEGIRTTQRLPQPGEDLVDGQGHDPVQARLVIEGALDFWMEAGPGWPEAVSG
jgi:hypothetical protein